MTATSALIATTTTAAGWLRQAARTGLSRELGSHAQTRVGVA